MNDKEKFILCTALTKYGIDKQTDMMIEEMSELTKALLKLRRHGHDENLVSMLLANVVEEIADVGIVLEQMRIYFSPAAVDEAKEHKMKRLAKLLGIEG